MNRPRIQPRLLAPLLAALLALPASLLPGQPAGDPAANPSATAREAALDLAGAFSNDGFKLRDGFWSGRLDPHGSRLLLVNLFAGNHYWFSVAVAGEAAGTPALELYDEEGRRLETEPWSDGARAAAGYSPAASGPHYLRVRAPGDRPVDFCLVYSYK